jgi:TetR/AcrR family transcriptional repressor of nem operon
MPSSVDSQVPVVEWTTAHWESKVVARSFGMVRPVQSVGHDCAMSLIDSLSSPPTRKGQETRQRIIDATTDLIFERGVGEVSLDDVRAATGTSKSQLYHYFNDKSQLVHAVIQCQRERVLGNHRPTFESLDSFNELKRWRDMIVMRQAARSCRSGCPLATLASGLIDVDEDARTQLVEAFSSWRRLIADGLAHMVEQGVLRFDTDTEALATSVLASLQGGLLLAEVDRDTRCLEVALDAALAHVRTFAASGANSRTSKSAKGRGTRRS